ncbi:MAG TPA: chemotaxis response regulator protein-glutamate methylesterase [Candidatus Dormibacteraeota bacterium]|nr:chemotaxis response regulator protein-glutamate methylesterase [Candidatus Dormibacteraeota bacterium]
MLLVDDAVVVRKVLAHAIGLDPALEVGATAVNGRVALVKFAMLKPDIVLLDIEMPEMNGLETVRELRKLDACVPIIMFSSLTERGASATLEALALGATDYVTKPSNIDGAATLEAISRELIPKIRALCHLPGAQSILTTPAKPSLPRVFVPPQSRLLSPAKLVVIGVSTGGPDALAQLLPRLPANLSVPVLIAQHMPAIFTSMLATRLSSKSLLPVRECVSGEPVSPGCAVIAPGDFHMTVQQENGSPVLKTHQGPKENFCRPSVDVLFRSVAAVYGERTLAVVLTGMGQDGLKGCEMLRTSGARIYVQDEASSVVWGMPGFVAKAGLADKILPLNQIASEIVRATTIQIAARTQS